MLRDLLGDDRYALNAVVGLLAFFLVFCGIAFWIFTRRKQHVDRWASLPLDAEGTPPREPRGAANGDDSSTTNDQR